MNRILLILLFLLLVTVTFAQQRPMQSLYMFDPLLINPAYAGNHVQLSATSIYRNQWVNFPGAPKTFTATVHSGFAGSRAGVGIIAGRDEIGIHGENSLYVAYSYKLPLSKYNNSTLSFGLQGGFNDFRSDFTKLTIRDPNDPYETVVNRTWTWNFGTGVYYRSDKGYFGISVPYGLNNKVVDFEDLDSQAIQRRYYYFTGGLVREVSPNVKLLPSALVRLQEKAPFSFDLNLVTVFYNAVGFGISYRNGGSWNAANGDAIVGLFELQINENFHVGYAYDYTLSAIGDYSNGSHEIMINYRVKINKIHRGLPCPAYW